MIEIPLSIKIKWSLCFVQNEELFGVDKTTLKDVFFSLLSSQEVSISKRFALKEAQNKLMQNLIKDAKLNEEQANAIIKDHLANMAAIDKATDEERARRVMQLEMRLAQRRALARQKVRSSVILGMSLFLKGHGWGCYVLEIVELI